MQLRLVSAFNVAIVVWFVVVSVVYVTRGNRLVLCYGGSEPSRTSKLLNLPFFKVVLCYKYVASCNGGKRLTDLVTFLLFD